MRVGMLWLDTDRSRSLNEKVKLAAEYYEEKYGRMPDLCLVNNGAINNEEKVGLVKIEAARTVLPNHFWLGMAS
ncbi:MAG: hypothetical protein JSV68_11895 [Anaerolineaceae bacterium]|nr:MAG: hypothetical protein JSV68_11895 [Anaerolineaceae bacterium]